VKWYVGYGFSDGLGIVEITIGLLTLLGVFSRRWGIVGATLSFLTLSFLITTPDAWVSALGDAQHGFPYLSGGGRLVLKDIMLLAGGLLIMADSARAFLEARLYAKLQTMTASKLSIAPAE
jgi:reactive chlorine resistance protein C